MQSITLRYSEVDPELYLLASKTGLARRAQRNPLGFIVKVAIWVGVFVITLFVSRIPNLAGDVIPFMTGLAAYVLISIIFIQLQKRSLRALIAQDQVARGETTATLDANGCTFSSSFGTSHINWYGIDKIIDLKQGTGLRSRLLVYPLPDDALPAGLTPDQFRKTLEAWRKA
jgi:hypothetical protein